MNRDLLRFLVHRHRLSCGLTFIVPLFIGTVIGFIYPTWKDQREMMEKFKFIKRFYGGEEVDLLARHPSPPALRTHTCGAAAGIQVALRSSDFTLIDVYSS